MTTDTRPPRAPAPAAQQRPVATAQFAWAVVVLSALLVAGLYVDLWAHAHGKVDQSFFTSWHGMLYGGYALGAAYLTLVALRSRRRGLPLNRLLPEGYGLSLAGAALFAVAGAGDMVWHMVFGIEREVEALFSPTHLLLAAGGTLIVAGPLRAALGRPSGANRLPAALSLAFVLAVLGAMTQFASPFVDVLPRTVPGASGDASAADSEILAMRPDGTAQTRLTMDTERAQLQPAWSPDGSRIAYVSQSGGDNPAGRIELMNADGSDPRSLTKGPHDGSPAWSPDGRRIAYSSTSTGGSSGSSSGGSSGSSSGGSSGGKRDVFVVDLATGATRRVTSTPNDEVVAGWSPDGTRILVASDQAGNWDVAVVDAATGSESLLTTTPSDDQSPAWSSDGRRIAFVSDRDGNLEIYSMRPDGTTQTRLTREPAGDFEPHWSPDGTQIAFASWRAGDVDVYTMRADGSRVADISRRPASDEYNGLSWSPAGIAFASQGHGPFWQAPYFRQALGMASIFIQTAILMGFVLLAARRRVLPFGGLAFVFTITAALMAVINDEYRLVPGAFVAGVAADVLVRRLRPAHDLAGFRWFAFAVPALYYAAYFAGVQATGGVGWSIHMWTGAVMIAGIIGVLLSYLVVPPARTDHRIA